MTAAFVLSINMFIASLFAVAFAVVASTHPTVRGARWLAAAYGVGVLDVVLEFILPWLVDPELAVVGIYLIYLTALTFGLIGVARHYGVKTPRLPITLVWGAAFLITPALLILPYDSTVRALLYQSPYASLQALMAWVVVRSGRKMALDKLLIMVSGLAVIFYLAKPGIAWKMGMAAGPQGYLSSQYAAISQTMGSVILIALALVLLLVIMRDTASEMVAQSETDPLSGVLNRRGFEARGELSIQCAKKNGLPLALITLDLDRFKSINDSFGHAAGDTVIADIADLLASAVEDRGMVARLGGEEFAILLPGRNSLQASELAEYIRTSMSDKLPNRFDTDKAVTASFGVAELQDTDELSDLCRRSDLALYEAKAAGRNTVATANLSSYNH